MEDFSRGNRNVGHPSHGKIVSAQRSEPAFRIGKWLSGSIFRKTSRVSRPKDDKALFRNFDEPTDLLSQHDLFVDVSQGGNYEDS
jgi:hypothetical protein